MIEVPLKLLIGHTVKKPKSAPYLTTKKRRSKIITNII